MKRRIGAALTAAMLVCCVFCACGGQNNDKDHVSDGDLTEQTTDAAKNDSGTETRTQRATRSNQYRDGYVNDTMRSAGNSVRDQKDNYRRVTDKTDRIDRTDRVERSIMT